MSRLCLAKSGPISKRNYEASLNNLEKVIFGKTLDYASATSSVHTRPNLRGIFSCFLKWKFFSRIRTEHVKDIKKNFYCMSSHYIKRQISGIALDNEKLAGIGANDKETTFKKINALHLFHFYIGKCNLNLWTCHPCIFFISCFILLYLVINTFFFLLIVYDDQHHIIL